MKLNQQISLYSGVVEHVLDLSYVAMYTRHPHHACWQVLKKNTLKIKLPMVKKNCLKSCEPVVILKTRWDGVFIDFIS